MLRKRRLEGVSERGRESGQRQARRCAAEQARPAAIEPGLAESGQTAEQNDRMRHALVEFRRIADRRVDGERQHRDKQRVDGSIAAGVPMEKHAATIAPPRRQINRSPPNGGERR